MQIRLALLIVVLVLSVLSVGTYIWSFYKDVPTIPFEIFMGLPTSIIALLGTGKEKKKRRKDKRERRRAKPFRLMPSFDSGLYGGLIGGAIAGLIIGVMYYVDFMNAGWRIIPHIFIYASLVGTLLGASVQLIILWFRRVLGVLLYDYEGRLRNVMRALLFSSVISAFAAMFGIVVLRFLNIGDPFFFSDATGIDFLAIEGGAILGLVIGIVLGFQVGCTLRLYRLWEVMTKPMGH
jgi:MFS family permease